MIDHGFHNRAGEPVTLKPVDDTNWGAVADVAPRDDQREFVAALAARYLLLADRGGVWNSLAILTSGQVVGHAMWAFDADDGAHWIGGVIVDASAQASGIGRAAMQTLIGWLRAEQSASAVRLSYAERNDVAARLYSDLGFQPTGEIENGEIVAELLLEP